MLKHNFRFSITLITFLPLTKRKKTPKFKHDIIKHRLELFIYFLDSSQKSIFITRNKKKIALKEFHCFTLLRSKILSDGRGGKKRNILYWNFGTRFFLVFFCVDDAIHNWFLIKFHKHSTKL